MGDKTKIQWTSATWNPIRARNLITGKTGWHCEHMTEACRFCYAERLNIKAGATGGTGIAYKPGHLGKDVEIYLHEKALLQPLRWRRGRTIFPCSMTDLFADFVTDDWIEKMFAVMALAEDHTFQVLTKRPARMARFFAGIEEGGEFHAGFRDAMIEGQAQNIYAERYPKERDTVSEWLAVHLPLPNVWLGTSICDQPDADKAVPELLNSPAALHWLSVEPMLGEIDLRPWLGKIGWVVVGGESGKNARPMAWEWVSRLLVQCSDAGVPFFFKQVGHNQSYWPGRFTGKGADPEEWPLALRVREFPRAM